MISWTAAESSIVLTSPTPFKSRSATFCSTRRIILPERVFGRPSTNCENDPKEWRGDSVQVCLKCLVFIENQWGRITWIQSGQAYLAIFWDTVSLSCWGKSIPWRSTPCFSTTKAYTPDNTERENCPFLVDIQLFWLLHWQNISCSPCPLISCEYPMTADSAT